MSYSSPTSLNPSSFAEPSLARVAFVDRSLAPALSLLSISAGLWLVLGSLCALVASLQLHLPEFLSSCEWLTYGRVRDLESVLLTYGFGFNAALAVALWIMHRLGKMESRHAWIAVLGVMGWNLALTWGALVILLSGSMGVLGLELPRETGPFLVGCFLVVAAWAVVAFTRRLTPHVYVSQWYIVAAVITFPILHLLAQVGVLWAPARGVLSPLIATWHVHGIVALVLTPIALAALYYLLPKELGRPIRSYYLASIAFWLVISLGGWTGMATLVGSPIPVWIQSTGVIAAVMLVVPAIIAAINFHGTLAQAGWSSVTRSPVLGFIIVAATGYLIWTLLTVGLAFRGVSADFRFTEVIRAHALLGLYGFIVPAFFAALYYLLPRLARREWPSQALVSFHFWLNLLGMLGAVGALGFLGWIQATATTDIQEISRHLNAAASVALALLVVGNVAFLFNLGALFLLPLVRPRPVQTYSR